MHDVPNLIGNRGGLDEEVVGCVGETLARPLKIVNCID
jgi:hypothetical protein